MSRSGYSEDCENLELYRANVERAIRGARGKAFLREMAAALDALPVKELVAGEIVRDSEHVCAIGAVAVARQMDVVADLVIDDRDSVGAAFGVTPILAAEIAFENDDDFGYSRDETDAARWTRMRAWVDKQLALPPIVAKKRATLTKGVTR